MLAEKIRQKKLMRLENELEVSSSEDEDEIPGSVASEAKESKVSIGPDGKPRPRRVKKKKCWDIKNYPTLLSASNSVEKFVEHQTFSNVIIIFICLNTIILAAEHYKMPEWLSKLSDVANLIFTLVFFFEMILKIFGLGCKKYIADGFNIFDCIIVWISMVELMMAREDNSGLSVLRASAR